MASKKAKAKKPNKRHILARLLELPKAGRRVFYAREMKILNTLCERYSLEFMDIVKFPKKESLAYMASDALRPKMDRKWRAFNYVPDESLYPEKVELSDEKHGKDLKRTKRPKTVKDFLDE
jgi:hypothetical protein